MKLSSQMFFGKWLRNFECSKSLCASGFFFPSTVTRYFHSVAITCIAVKFFFFFQNILPEICINSNTWYFLYFSAKPFL